jgi:hypothetical protein
VVSSRHSEPGIDKVKVLSLLNSDFFEEISKKELDELGKTP